MRMDAELVASQLALLASIQQREQDLAAKERALASIQQREQDLAAKERAFKVKEDNTKQPLRHFQKGDTFQDYNAVKQTAGDWQTITNKTVTLKQSGEKKGFYQ
jgi:hypothetical protein